MTSRRCLGTLIAVSALLRLLFAAGLGPGNDEAYHYLLAVHPDWSYYDHPPMMAVVERLGLAVGGTSALALRLGFVGLFAGTTWLMARLATRCYGERAGLLAAVLLNATAYYGVAASTFALPDGPLAFFWLLTLDRLLAAFERPEKLGRWAWAGAAWGGAMLSKYHGLLLPAGAVVYLILEPPARRALRRPGPYLAVLIGLAVFAPVIAWNAAHGWASFAFQSSRAAGGGFRPDALLGAIGGQALYLLPWIWVPLLVSLAGCAARVWRRGASPADRFLLAMAVVPSTAFLVVACRRAVLPHWSLIGFLAVLPMLGRDWSRLDARRVRRRSAWALAVPAVLAMLAVAQARLGLIQMPKRSQDPTIDLVGWDQVAAELGHRGLLDNPRDFLFTGKWYYSGQLAFATRGAVPVLCYNPKAAHNFAYWSRPESWVGRDGVLVVVNASDVEPQVYAPWFRRIEAAGDFEVRRAGGPIRSIHIYRCVDQLRPFPFDGVEGPRPAVASRGDGGSRAR